MKKLLFLCVIGVLFVISTRAISQTIPVIEDKPVYGVEHMPQFPGGDEELMKFIQQNLHYPKKAAETGVEGRSTIRFIVGRDGVVRDATVIRGFNADCDEEALRVVKLLPTWIPGKQNGQNVSVYYTLPIVYKLSKDSSSSVSNEPLLLVDGIQRPYSLLKDPIQLKQIDIKSAGVLSDSDATALYGDKGKNGVILITTKNGAAKQDSVESADTPVYGVETMPQFPGGEDALIKFIKRNLRYPTSEAHRRIQGRTVIKFVINKTGKVCDVTVARSLSAECDAEAVRVVNLMPNWKPGYQSGKPTSVYYTLPVVYMLQKEGFRDIEQNGMP